MIRDQDRGPHTLTGSLDNEEAADAAFSRGWFHSGDIGHFDAGGVLWFSDRRKDVIKTGGENVASIEVENALCAADQNIAEAVAIGLPHERWTEAITAIIVPAQGCGHTIRPPGSKIPQKEEAGAAVDP